MTQVARKTRSVRARSKADQREGQTAAMPMPPLYRVLGLVWTRGRRILVNPFRIYRETWLLAPLQGRHRRLCWTAKLGVVVHKWRCLTSKRR